MPIGIQETNVVRKNITSGFSKTKARLGGLLGAVSLAAGIVGGTSSYDVVLAKNINSKIETAKFVLMRNGISYTDIKGMEQVADEFLSKDYSDANSFTEQALKKSNAWQKAIDTFASVNKEKRAYQKGQMDIINKLLESVTKKLEEPPQKPHKNLLKGSIDIPNAEM